MKVFQSGILSLLGGLVVGCSTATERSDLVAQHRIHQKYTAVYDQKTDTTSATAEFRFGDFTGTTLQLVAKSNVSNNHYSLEERNSFGTFYHGNGAGFQTEHQFVFIDNDEKAYTNAVSIRTIAFPGATPAAFSRSAGFTLAWEGAPLEKNETVELSLENNRNAEDVVQRTDVVGATSITVPPSLLSELRNGNKMMRLRRGKTIPLQQGTERGGYLSASYLTSERTITAED